MVLQYLKNLWWLDTFLARDNHNNDEFPNAISILTGIKEEINKAGGEMNFLKMGILQ